MVPRLSRGPTLTIVLVTGAAGFVGSRLVASAASSQVMEIRALVRRTVGYLPVGAQIVCDLLDEAHDLGPNLANVDTIVHLAGANEIAARREPDRALEETVRATERLLDAATRAGVRRMIFVSTVHVYGAAIVEDAILTETTATSPLSVYARARLECEELLEARCDDRLEVVVLRLTNSIGAPVAVAVDRWTLVANDLCRQAAVGNRMELTSDGSQWRDFVGLRDVVEILETAALHPEVVTAGTYNLGSGTPMTIRMLAHLVQNAFAEITGRRPALAAPDPLADPPRSFRVDLGRLGAIGLAPAADVESAVAETARFCLTHKEHL